MTASSTGGQRVLAPAQIGQPVGLVVQRHGEVGGEGVGAGGGQLAVDGDRFVAGGQRVLGAGPDPPAEFDWLFSDVARSGVNGVGAGVGQLPVDGDGFVAGGQRLLAPAQVAPAGSTGCSAPWRGRG